MRKRAHLTGGKVTVSGYDNAWMTGVIDAFELDAASSTQGSWQMMPFNLSVPRESTTAAAVGGSLIVAGGWAKKQGKYQGDNTVDIFSQPEHGGDGNVQYALKNGAYAVGAVTINKTAYIVGNEQVYRFGELREAAPAVPLPPAMVGVYDGGADSGGLVPAAHVQQNGVAVGKWACFWVSVSSRRRCHRRCHRRRRLSSSSSSPSSSSSSSSSSHSSCFSRSLPAGGGKRGLSCD